MGEIILPREKAASASHSAAAFWSWLLAASSAAFCFKGGIQPRLWIQCSCLQSLCGTKAQLDPAVGGAQNRSSKALRRRAGRGVGRFSSPLRRDLATGEPREGAQTDLDIGRCSLCRTEEPQSPGGRGRLGRSE